ncbi:MAG: hypothetical protein ACRC57_08985 [Sarcina sp.]
MNIFSNQASYFRIRSLLHFSDFPVRLSSTVTIDQQREAMWRKKEALQEENERLQKTDLTGKIEYLEEECRRATVMSHDIVAISPPLEVYAI